MAARASARRVACTNNLKQIALAMHAFESRSGYFPSFTGPDKQDLERRQHNYIAFILNDLEETYLADRYSFEYEWHEALRPSPEYSNLSLATVKISSVICPSSPDTSDTGTADYAICVGFASWPGSARQRLLETGEISPRRDWQSMLDPIDEQENRYRNVERQHVGDGLSNSVMLCEDAARPDFYIEGSRALNDPREPVSGASWADPEGEFSVDEVCGGLLLNCNNDNEIYSFHVAGANFAFGDASIRFLNENISPEALVSLLTRNAGD